MIEAGVAGVHFEDQLASVKKCGHLGGKVLVPTREFIDKLVAARLAADVCGVPTVLVARTDANSANLMTSDIDPYDAPFLSGGRTHEGFFEVKMGVEQASARGLAYAPYADLLWMETGKPDLSEAKQFAEAVHAKYPGKLLAYNCSPSFNWRRHLSEGDCEKFQRELGAMGYKFQFVTLSGFHQLNYGMFQLARHYETRGMAAYAALQDEEFARRKRWLSGREASAVRGHRLLRPGHRDRHRRNLLHQRHERLHRSRTVPLDHAENNPKKPDCTSSRASLLQRQLTSRTNP